MKQVLFTLLLYFIFTLTYAQVNNENSRILDDIETKTIFTNKIKSDLRITYPIFRTYYFKDNTGEHYLVLTERAYKKDQDEPLNDTIQGFCLRKADDHYSVDWSIKDFILKENKASTPEFSIWFWTKYIALQDLDGDGTIDPVLIYGTSGKNGTDDGRIKILIFYKGQKMAIRHQNGTLDFERNTQIDPGFYNLPDKIQKYVKGLMDGMTENNQAIFPYGYKEKMDAKQTYFDEK